MFPQISRNRKSYRTLTYFVKTGGRLAVFKKKQDIEVVFKAKKTLERFTKNNKDILYPNKKSCMYKLKCGSSS